MIDSPLIRYNRLFFERVEKHLSKKTFLSSSINFLINVLFNAMVTVIIFLRESARRREFNSASKLVGSGCSTEYSRLAVIVAETSVGSLFRYRVEPKVRYLEEMGFSVGLFSLQDALSALPFLRSARFLVLYRLPFNVIVKQLISCAREAGLDIFYDIDDLIFEREAFASSSMMKSVSSGERREHLRAAEHYFQALKLCDFGIASTAQIAMALSKHLPRGVFLLENGILPTLLKASELPKPPRSSKMIWIGYGSGSKTHDADFRVCSTALLQVLEKYSNAGLVIHGELELDPEFSKFGNRVRHVGFMPAQYYYRSIGLFDINLAPLVDDIFNEAKSNLKFIEAALFDVPTVASPTEPFRKIIRSGENGILACSEEEWVQALSRLIDDASLREKMGREAHRSAKEAYGFSAQLATFEDIFSRFKVSPLRWRCSFYDEIDKSADVSLVLRDDQFEHSEEDASCIFLDLASSNLPQQIEIFARAARGQIFEISEKASQALAIHLASISKLTEMKIQRTTPASNLTLFSDPRETTMETDLGMLLAAHFALADQLSASSRRI